MDEESRRRETHGMMFLVDALLKFVRGGGDDDADKHAGSVSEAISARR